MKEVCIN